MRILIVHPEGNINNNPNLTAMVNAFHEEGFAVDVLAEIRGEIYQHDSGSFNLYLVSNINFILRMLMSEYFHAKALRYLAGRLGRSYDFIIGVDAVGIILGEIISRASGVPLALISYEIFFAGEIGADEKLPEIRACRNVCFAVAPDPVRAQLLSDENHIPLEKIICIPVSAEKIEDRLYDREYIRTVFGIDNSKKVALYMGSLDDWAGKGLLLEDIRNWPPDWVLLLHGRYRPSSELWQEIQSVAASHPGKIILSGTPFTDPAEMYNLPMSADIGIAMYLPDNKTRHTGNNIKHIGFSSGKIAGYLNCGLPVLVNDIGALSADIVKFELGFVLGDGARPSDVLKSISPDILKRQKENCRTYFIDKLDFALYKTALIDSVLKYKAEAGRNLSGQRLEMLCGIYNAVYRILKAVYNMLSWLRLLDGKK